MFLPLRVWIHQKTLVINFHVTAFLHTILINSIPCRHRILITHFQNGAMVELNSSRVRNSGRKKVLMNWGPYIVACSYNKSRYRDLCLAEIAIANCFIDLHLPKGFERSAKNSPSRIAKLENYSLFLLPLSYILTTDEDIRVISYQQKRAKEVEFFPKSPVTEFHNH